MLGRTGRQAGKVTRQARSPGRQSHQTGEVARQARPVRPSCAGGGVGCQAGEAGQAVMCVSLGEWGEVVRQ